MATKKAKSKAGRPPRLDKDNKTVKSSEKGTIPGDLRKTYIVNAELAHNIDLIATLEKTTVKSIVNEIFTGYVVKYEKKNGPLKPVKK